MRFFCADHGKADNGHHSFPVDAVEKARRGCFQVD